MTRDQEDADTAIDLGLSLVVGCIFGVACLGLIAVAVRVWG